MEVQSKRMTKQRLQHDSSLHYVMQFVHLGQAAEKVIEDYGKRDQNHKESDIG
jgi:hypothetical protein